MLINYIHSQHSQILIYIFLYVFYKLSTRDTIIKMIIVSVTQGFITCTINTYALAVRILETEGERKGEKGSAHKENERKSMLKP